MPTGKHQVERTVNGGISGKNVEHAARITFPCTLNQDILNVSSIFLI
jgi:hypothetical protein